MLLKYGNTNTYFVGGLLIDTDMAGTFPQFCKALKQSGLSLTDIKYVAATHYHPDHCGLISELMAHGVRLLLIDRQRDFVHFPDPIFNRQPHINYLPINENDADVITFAESRDFLKELGIDGVIVPTESHSEDGIAIITDGGDCYVGDLEPMQYIEAYGYDSPIKLDWDRIMSYNPTRAYFGHINPQNYGSKADVNISGK